MKNLFCAITALTLLAALPSALAADKGDPKVELQQLIGKIQAKAKSGKRAAADYGDELKELDALIASHVGEKSEEVASFLMLKAQIFSQLFEDDEQAAAALKQLKTDFPATEASKNADRVLAMMEQQSAAKKIQAGLKEGAVFPDFAETDIEGKPLSVARFKGKVVLVDFWATWCGPCVAELPNVLKAYSKYHDDGFEIIGISLDQDKEALTKFIKENKMPWPQFFDGKGFENKLSAQYGITGIPMTYLIDRDGKIIGRSLRGEALDTAVAAAVAKK